MRIMIFGGIILLYYTLRSDQSVMCQACLLASCVGNGFARMIEGLKNTSRLCNEVCISRLLLLAVDYLPVATLALQSTVSLYSFSF